MSKWDAIFISINKLLIWTSMWLWCGWEMSIRSVGWLSITWDLPIYGKLCLNFVRNFKDSYISLTKKKLSHVFPLYEWYIDFTNRDVTLRIRITKGQEGQWLNMGNYGLANKVSFILTYKNDGFGGQVGQIICEWGDQTLWGANINCVRPGPKIYIEVMAKHTMSLRD